MKPGGTPPPAGPTLAPKRRIEIVNPSDGGFFYWLLRLYAFAAIAVVTTVAFAGFGLYVYFSSTLPPLPDLSRYADDVPGVTTFYAQDGTILAEFARERREVVPLDRVPQKLIDAFISTEDRRFFSHGGIDYRGTLRALVTNLRRGQVEQGGSTITQQVAKSYLSSVRSYTRKIREAILARRLEARYSKRAILALYLNQIFLGSGAYGVQAAARKYFDKDVSQLDLGEMAVIAGLARAPSRDSPLVSMDDATERRNVVLGNMVAVGAISEEEAKAVIDMPLVVRPRHDYFHDVSPYFAEHVRRELIKKYGQQGFYDGGYRVETTVLPYLDVLAADNVDVAVRKLDKRQGFRGAEARLGADMARLFRERAKTLYGSAPLLEGKLYLGLVESVAQGEAKVLVGTKTYPLPVRNMSWASRYSASDATNDRQIGSASDALKKGDVIWVRWAFRSQVGHFQDFTYNQEGDAIWAPEQPLKKPPAGPQILALDQQPRVSGSLFNFDHHNGYVLAMAGGNDFDASEFNRVVQSCRQPGSAYKPIYYSLALDDGYSFATEWNDKPKAEVDPVTGELWVPQNIDGTYGVRVSLERALVWSKNPPSGEIFATLGTKAIADWHKKLGFSTPLVPSEICLKKYCPSLALGASCVHTDDLSRAFAVFARGGRPIENVYVRRILDRHGRVLEDHTAWDDPLLSSSERLDRVAAEFGNEPEPVIPARTAWLTSTLLRRIVTQGHSGPIRATKVIAAGKTGTSSRTSDVWFVGYTSRWLTTAWIGDDTYERELGYKDASFMLSVPMWARYMAAAVGTMPLDEIPWDRPPGVKANDVGGPLKPGFAPPPAPGMDATGHPYQLPPKLQGAVMTAPATPGGGLPENLVPQKVIRVATGVPVAPKPAPATANAAAAKPAVKGAPVKAAPVKAAAVKAAPPKAAPKKAAPAKPALRKPVAGKKSAAGKP